MLMLQQIKFLAVYVRALGRNNGAASGLSKVSRPDRERGDGGGVLENSKGFETDGRSIRGPKVYLVAAVQAGGGKEADKPFEET